ncbi:MAG: hypothetical protein LC632_04350 [Xanthomonadaceae bacterium]|nr:hypothetical protein [Xanthomonadaceae bacterium]
MTEARCWKCGVAHDRVLRELQRSDVCRACGAAFHSCRMCRHHAPSLHRKCREDRADPPRNTEHANFCDWFDPAEQAGEEAQGDDAAARARAELDALFGK